MTPNNPPQNSPEFKPLSWDTESPSLWSLFDMLSFAASSFFTISATLSDLSAYDGVLLATDVGVPEMTAKLDLLAQHAANLGLTLSLKHIEFLKFTIRSGVTKTDIWANILREIGQRVHDELEVRTFLFIPGDDAILYNNPIAGFGLSYAAFPSARHDMREAARCHALGCYTASVYHCMAIAQAGLYALANDLKVEFDYPLELAVWQGVIEAIETKIEPMRHLPRAEKDTKLPFYSECAVQFRYFKDAWRNHVAHMREEYDRDQSHSIFLHVRDFMEKLSTRIKETYVPVP